MTELHLEATPLILTRPLVVRMLERLSTWWALAGGAFFVALVLMSVVSIVGRKLFATPVNGDMELLMMGTAVGSASFLAFCEITDQHIKVDALTTWMGERFRAALDTVAHGLLALVGIVLTWRTVLYAFECHESLEVSPLLGIPLWQPVALLVPSLVLLVLTALCRAYLSARLVTGEYA